MNLTSTGRLATRTEFGEEFGSRIWLGMGSSPTFFFFQNQAASHICQAMAISLNLEKQFQLTLVFSTN